MLKGAQGVNTVSNAKAILDFTVVGEKIITAQEIGQIVSDISRRESEEYERSKALCV